MNEDIEALLRLLDQSKEQLDSEMFFYKVIDEAKARLFYQSRALVADDLNVPNSLMWHWLNKRQAPTDLEERTRVYDKLRAIAINPVRDVRERLEAMAAVPKMWGLTNEGFLLQILVLLECSNIDTTPFKNFVKGFQARLPDAVDEVIAREAVKKALRLI